MHVLVLLILFFLVGIAQSYWAFPRFLLLIWILRVGRREFLPQVFILLHLLHIGHKNLGGLHRLNWVIVNVVLITRLLWISLFLLASSFPAHPIIRHASGCTRTARCSLNVVLHHHNLIIALSFARTYLHLLWHKRRRCHHFLFFHIRIRIKRIPIALSTDITYPVPLAHQLVCLWHLHQALAIQLARRCFTLVLTFLLELVNEIVLGVVRVVIYHLLDPHFMARFLGRQISRATSFQGQLLRLVERFATRTNSLRLPANLLFTWLLLLLLLRSSTMTVQLLVVLKVDGHSWVWETSNCCLWASSTLGTRIHIIILDHASIARFTTYLKVTVFYYILINVVQVVLLSLLVVALTVGSIFPFWLTLAGVLPGALDHIFGSVGRILPRIIGPLGRELFCWWVDGSLLSNRVYPISLKILLAKHPVSYVKFALTQSVFVDILGILVQVFVRLLFPLLAYGDWVTHAQNLSKFRALVLDSMQIESELSTISFACGIMVIKFFLI